MTKRLKGAQSRSREQNLEGEIQPSKIFRTFERKETKANHISSVRLGDHWADGQQEVVAAFESHYTHLFGRRESDTTAQQTFLHKLATTPEGSSNLRYKLQLCGFPLPSVSTWYCAVVQLHDHSCMIKVKDLKHPAQSFAQSRGCQSSVEKSKCIFLRDD